MLLRKITLEEFGAYRGKQSLDLTPKKNKPIILIGGLNGCGKTTLLDAIQLALYGNRARCSGRGTKSYEVYLRESINRKADPARGSAITLEFTVLTGGQEHYYRVVRSWHTSGKTLKEFLNVYVDETYGERVKSSRNVQPDGKFNRLLSEGWADHVESLLPLEIASLAFFDGEKIESLADPERAASVIESAVHSLLGVSTVQQLRNDLLALQRRQKLSDEEQHLLDNIRAQETERDAVLSECDVAHQEWGHSGTELGKAQRKLESLEEAFGKEGGHLFTRRVELENDKKQILDQLAQTRTELTQLAAGPLPLLLAAPSSASCASKRPRSRKPSNRRTSLRCWNSAIHGCLNCSLMPPAPMSSHGWKPTGPTAQKKPSSPSTSSSRTTPWPSLPSSTRSFSATQAAARSCSRWPRSSPSSSTSSTASW